MSYNDAMEKFLCLKAQVDLQVFMHNSFFERAFQCGQRHL
jgi:hypothetical protein